jgi:nitroreductase
MDIMELLKTRRTYRRFEQKPVPQDVVDDILEAARIANCSANRQRLRYLVIQKPEDINNVFHLTKWAAALPKEVGTPKENERPTLFIAVLEDTSSPVSCDTDAGIALANMTTAAWAKGVGSCIMASINRPALAKLFHLKEGLVLHTVVAFGYPTHKSILVDVRDGNKNYYLDENNDYCVPKYAKEDIVTYL